MGRIPSIRQTHGRPPIQIHRAHLPFDTDSCELRSTSQIASDWRVFPLASATTLSICEASLLDGTFFFLATPTLRDRRRCMYFEPRHTDRMLNSPEKKEPLEPSPGHIASNDRQ